MLKKLFSMVPGHLTVSTDDVKRAGNIILHRKIVCSNMRAQDGRLYFDLDLPSFKQKIKNFDEFGIKWKIEKAQGLAFFIYKYQKRYGLFLGFAIFIALLFISQSFVWSVRVAPVPNVDSEQIIENLGELGFGVGSFIPKENVLALSNSYLLRYDDLSYIAINIIGNCAEIVTLPAFETPSPQEIDYPSSIIASRDGHIQRMEIFSGSAVKSAGQSVQKGEVIVSGLVSDERDETYRLVRASAKVYAKTFRQFTVNIPLETEEKIKTSDIKIDRSMRFFAKEINFLKNGCVFDKEYDIMVVREPLVLFDRIALPIYINTTTATKVAKTKKKIDENTAKNLADKKLLELIEKEDIEVLSINKQYKTDKNTFTMVCTIYCIENIAVEIPMSGVPINQKE